jgi:glucose/mannose transport system permease protein
MSLRRATPHLLLALLAIVFVAPLVLMILTSLKSLAQINNDSLFALPSDPSLAAWIKAWGTACIGQECKGISGAFVNSFAIVLPALILSLLLGAITGFALSLQTSRFDTVLFVALLIGLFVPAQVTLFPMIVLLRELGLFGTRAGVVLVHVVWGLPFVTLLFRSFFLGVPRSIVNAARIDGAGFFAVFWRVMLPASLPACAAALVLQFTFLWNDFLLGLTFAGSENRPVTVALSVLTGAQFGAQEYNVNIAAAIIAALPTICVYLAARQLFMRGWASESTIKG